MERRRHLDPAQIRIGTEIAHSFHAVRYPGRVHALDELVWSKLSYVLGYVHPSETPFDAATELALPKTFLDHMWERPLVDIIDHLSGIDGDAFDTDHSALAESLNAGVAAHALAITASRRLTRRRCALVVGIACASDEAGGVQPLEQRRDCPCRADCPGRRQSAAHRRAAQGPPAAPGCVRALGL